jgi:hypothetical protein
MPKQNPAPLGRFSGAAVPQRDLKIMSHPTNQDRIEQQDKAETAHYLSGCTDAGCGRVPQFADETYMAGYLATLRNLPTAPDGRIIYDPQHPSIAIEIEF